MNKAELFYALKHKQIPEITIEIKNILIGDVNLHHTEVKAGRPASWVAAPIRLFANTFFNHASINNFADSQNSELKVVEAVGRGVLPSDFVSRMLGCTILILRPKEKYQSNTEGEKIALIQKINDRIGTKYDFGGCLLHQLWFNLTGKWIGRKKSAAENKFYCYEFVAWVWQSIPFLKNWWEIKPKMWLEKIDEDFDIVYFGKVKKII